MKNNIINNSIVLNDTHHLKLKQMVSVIFSSEYKRNCIRIIDGILQLSDWKTGAIKKKIHWFEFCSIILPPILYSKDAGELTGDMIKLWYSQKVHPVDFHYEYFLLNKSKFTDETEED